MGGNALPLALAPTAVAGGGWAGLVVVEGGQKEAHGGVLLRTGYQKEANG